MVSQAPFPPPIQPSSARSSRLTTTPISRHEQDLHRQLQLLLPQLPRPTSQASSVLHALLLLTAGPSHWSHHASRVLPFLPATCARLSRFKLHHQSQLVWSGKPSQPIKAGSSAWDGWWCLSTGQPDSSKDNASMQQVNSITPSPAHDWRLSHRCFVPACLVRKPRDAPLMLVVSFMTIDHPSLAGHPHHPESQAQPGQPDSQISQSSPSLTSLQSAVLPDAQYRSCASDFHGRAVD